MVCRQAPVHRWRLPRGVGPARHSRTSNNPPNSRGEPGRDVSFSEDLLKGLSPSTRVDELIAICFFVGCDRGMSCSVGLGWSHEPRLMGDASTELQQRGEVIERHPA